MQFSASLVTLTLAALALASPTRRDGNQCNTGDMQCCQSVQSASSEQASHLLGLLNIAVSSVELPIGITCTPISVVGLGGNSCNASPVCCENNSFHGVVALGCVPINISL